jgi:ParB family chromosome partitioning protein
VGKLNFDNIKKTAERAAQAADSLKLVPTLEYVRCDKIKFHPNNRFAEEDDEQAIQDLADDIDANGILHTIVLNNRGDEYRILSGEKRFRAALLLKKETVPCNVYDHLDDAAELRILYSANLEVRKYSAAQIFQYYKELSEMLQRQRDEGTYQGSISNGIAKIMRISVRQVQKYAKICSGLSEEQMLALENNQISINDANRITRKKNEPVRISDTEQKNEPVRTSDIVQKNEPVRTSDTEQNAKAGSSTDNVGIEHTLNEKINRQIGSVKHELIILKKLLMQIDYPADPVQEMLNSLNQFR